ncbi:ABC transporter ATP-binding protein [Actinomadura sp. KC345]|uniref:ABC transporter ATP-binding protein n=1 Tax=Actinomadura sp. KC345 TaxID=2530371 RepID=UPI001043C608|nr:ABC transporter ATP-binding protein [Actinomadura sp. KC345]TDC57499.1 ABC transporter ATP-binding protein [Actinomadura sp. KC345]
MRDLGTAVRLIWRGHRAGALVTLTGSLVLGVVPVTAAWLTKLIVDGLAGRPSQGDVPRVLLIGGLVAAFLFGQLGQGWLRYLQELVSRRIEFVVQSELFAALNRHPGLAVFERPGFHDRLELAQRAGQVAPHQLVTAAGGLLQAAGSLAGFVAALIAVSPAVAGLAGAAVAPQLVADLRLARRRVATQVELSPAQRRTLFYARLQAEPQAAKESRIFGLGDFFHGRMVRELDAIIRTERALEWRVFRVQAGLDALSAAAIGVGMALIVRSAMNGTLTPGDTVVALAALPAMALAMAGTVQQLAVGKEALLVVGHYRALVASGPAAAAEGAAAPPLRDGITFEDVWFRYGDDLPWVLRGVNLRIRCRHSVAVVGLNGAGKSTLVKLLTRLYEPTKGRILWDGTDIAGLDPDSLRQRIGVVFQDFMTYDLTAVENIGLGDLRHLGDPARVGEAAKLAGIHGAIEELPDGYGTMLSRTHGPEHGGGRTGVMPSGGQWQRLALARMLMRADRDLLILDEPSAGLDAEAEYEVHRVIHRRTEGRTRLLVSHRLNAVRMAELIVVLDGGVVSEAGTHQELIGERGRYAGLFHRQAHGYRD